MQLNKIGIIGLGSIGKRHLRLIKKLRPNLDVTLIRSGLNPHSEDENFAERVVFSIEEAGAFERVLRHEGKFTVVS